MYGALSRDVSGLSYSLEIMSYEESVELRATQWNDTDETISYEDLRGYGDPAFVIANASSCDVIWREDGWREGGSDYTGSEYRVLLRGESTQWYREWDRDVNQGGYGHAPPGTYLVYVIYRSPLGYFIPLPARVEVKAVQRSDPPAAVQKTEPALRTIDLGPLDPIVARHGNTLILLKQKFREGDHSKVFYEFDIDTGQKTEIPEPENVGPRGPQPSCEPSPGLKAVEVDFTYEEYSSEDENGVVDFDVKGVLEVDLKSQVATLLVFVGPDGHRYVYGYFDLLNIVWADDCRYAA